MQAPPAAGRTVQTAPATPDRIWAFYHQTASPAVRVIEAAHDSGARAREHVREHGAHAGVAWRGWMALAWVWLGLLTSLLWNGWSPLAPIATALFGWHDETILWMTNINSEPSLPVQSTRMRSTLSAAARRPPPTTRPLPPAPRPPSPDAPVGVAGGRGGVPPGPRPRVSSVKLL